ncbi:YkgJ family cysteine cluster protein [Xanthomonas axonopodis pv. nakataecorchori]|uniref:YkgJ family cysteine cluster protein n=1 Tax=Xanthomonas TaxID=338 RepID=UPI001C488C52|nr:YkgJ family cysteine cluster protein [Xanthomonas campestris pv. coriandri]
MHLHSRHATTRLGFTSARVQGVWCMGGRNPVSPSFHLALSIDNLCERCDAVCCRLTVMVDPSDRIPHHLTSVTPQGWHVMARDEEGWCVAIDAARMCCSIYETRPAICRRFVMSGPYCRDVRATYDDQRRRGIPLTLYNA